MAKFKFSSLISEETKEDGSIIVSLGRVSFWIIFGFCSFFWFGMPVAAFPPNLFQTLVFLMIYNISKKSVKALDVALKSWADKKLGSPGDIAKLVGEVVKASK